MNGRGQSEGGVDLSGRTEVRLNGGCRSEEGRGHRGHSAGGTGAKEGWAAEDPWGDWYGTLRKHKLGGVDPVQCVLLRGRVVGGWGRGTPVAHGIAALSDRVAAGGLDIMRGVGDGSDNRVLPDGWRTDTYGGERGIIKEITFR